LAKFLTYTLYLLRGYMIEIIRLVLEMGIELLVIAKLHKDRLIPIIQHAKRPHVRLKAGAATAGVHR